MSLRRFLRRRHWDAERARELQSYIDIETDDNVARGMPFEAARRAAYRKLGNPTLVREEIYQMNTLGWLETLLQDLRYGARLLRLNPAFSAVAIFSLALGVGANTAIFQLIDAVRLRPLPVPAPDTLAEVRIAERRGASGSFTGRRPQLTYALWRELSESQQAFSSMAAWTTSAFDLADGGEARFADGLYVSGAYFQTFGIGAEAGRLVTPADDRPGCAAAPVILSHAFWTREFNANPAVIGTTIKLDGRPFEIAGVSRRGFFGADVGRRFDVALPLCAEPLMNAGFSAVERTDGWFLAVIGRLRPGTSVEAAAAQLRALSPGLFAGTVPTTYDAELSKRYRGYVLAAFPAANGVSSIRRAYETPLWVLLGTTGLVLLIACANLANLMLARATAREREIAVRLAIGASRRRIVRQLMSESLLLAVAGAVCGALLAGWMSGFLVSFLDTASDAVFVDLRPDPRVFGFAATLALVTCVLFGLAPAIRATHTEPASSMKSGTRSVTDGRERFGLRRALVVIQVALSLVLLVGALLFVRTLTNLQKADLGFDPRGLAFATLDFARAGVPAERYVATHDALTDSVRAAEGVLGAAQVDIVPLSGSSWNNDVIVDGRVQTTLPNFNRVSPGYFAMMRIPMLDGRDFAASDDRSSSTVAIVNRSFARTFFGGASPIGRTFQVQEAPGRPRPHYQIVGVVGDTTYSDIRAAHGPVAFLPAAQDEDPGAFVQIVFRTDPAVPRAAANLVASVQRFNPSISVQVDTIGSRIQASLLPERLMAMLSGFFGALAALIATIGLYGVMSYMVSRRRTEIGIRMALGADAVSVVRLILRESAVLVAAGLAVGLGLAVLGARQAQALLFGLAPGDPLTLACAAIGLAAVAAVATYVPAQRASRVDPTVALRQE